MLDVPGVGTVTVPVKVGDASGAYGASRLVKPTPLTVPLALSEVNAPVLGVVEPIPICGAARVPYTNAVDAALDVESPAPRFGTPTFPVSVGEADKTTEPVPVDDVDPVPPLAAVNGFCNVMLLNVGDG